MRIAEGDQNFAFAMTEYFEAKNMSLRFDKEQNKDDNARLQD